MARKNYILMKWFVVEKHALLIFYSASPLKQQSMGRQVAPLRHIILIPVLSYSLMLFA
jgi:hypothetical protein